MPRMFFRIGVSYRPSVEVSSGRLMPFSPTTWPDVLSKPCTTDLRPWLWGAALTERSEHSPRTIVVGVVIVRGSSPHLPRSDQQEEAKGIFGPSVLTPTSHASCSIRIGAYARGVVWYGVERWSSSFSIRTVSQFHWSG